MKTFGGSRFQILTKLILPASLNTIVSNMKVNIGLCLVGVIIGEFLAARAGLGYVIIYNSQIFNMDPIAMSIIILCIISMILFKIIDLIQKCVEKLY
jgi:NitT/TauT family transport system permease protein